MSLAIVIRLGGCRAPAIAFYNHQQRWHHPPSFPFIWQNGCMFDESFAEAWRLRYGGSPPDEFPSLARFLSHRSVREYSAKPVPLKLVMGLMAAAQSAATSSNLQLWSAISVEDTALRDQVAQLCADQVQVRTAPWFFAFCADHHRLKYAASQNGDSAEGLDFTEFAIMAYIDAALAAERMVCAAESLGLGICYIGALRNNPEAIAEVLGLPEGVFGLFGLCLGYPSESSKAQIKPRLSQQAVWFRNRYNPEPPIAEYDERMEPFYIGQGMKGAVTWSMRSGRRADGKHMTGREVLMDYLRRNGFAKR